RPWAGIGHRIGRLQGRRHLEEPGRRAGRRRSGCLLPGGGEGGGDLLHLAHAFLEEPPCLGLVRGGQLAELAVDLARFPHHLWEPLWPEHDQRHHGDDQKLGHANIEHASSISGDGWSWSRLRPKYRPDDPKLIKGLGHLAGAHLHPASSGRWHDVRAPAQPSAAVTWMALKLRAFSRIWRSSSAATSGFWRRNSFAFSRPRP